MVRDSESHPTQASLLGQGGLREEVTLSDSGHKVTPPPPGSVVGVLGSGVPVSTGCHLPRHSWLPTVGWTGEIYLCCHSQ